MSMMDMEQLNNSRRLPSLQNPGSEDARQVNNSDYVAQWISQTEFDDSSSEASSFVYTSSVVDSESYLDDIQSLSLNEKRDTSILDANGNRPEIRENMNVLQQVFNTQNSVQTLGANQSNTVSINTATGPVHIGNVTYITGPIHITDTRGGHIGVINNSGGGEIQLTSTNDSTQVEQNVTISGQNVLRTTATTPATTTQRPRLPSNVILDDQLEEEERAEVNNIDAFVGNINRNIAANLLNIIERRTWLAHEPLEPYSFIEGPVPYVIISHTATILTRTQADTVYMVKHIQVFHIESCRWNDIGYNFLIGGDGNVYEGRGWGVVGAHTRGYNKRAMGISFVGCFMKELPPRESLNACKLLIKRGVEEGHIARDYQLLAHCQCSATQSPGRRLFEELQTWPQFCHDPKTVV